VRALAPGRRLGCSVSATRLLGKVFDECKAAAVAYKRALRERKRQTEAQAAKPKAGRTAAKKPTATNRTTPPRRTSRT